MAGFRASEINALRSFSRMMGESGVPAPDATEDSPTSTRNGTGSASLRMKPISARSIQRSAIAGLSYGAVRTREHSTHYDAVTRVRIMLRRSEENQIAVLPSSRILPPSTCLSIRTFCRRFVASSVLLLTLAPALLAAPKPLWPGSHYTEQDREAALERGLKFIYRIASNPANFSQSGPDLLFCFYTISSTARSHDLRNMARTMGRELALEWRRQHREPPTDNAAEVYLFVLGTLASDG